MPRPTDAPDRRFRPSVGLVLFGGLIGLFYIPLAGAIVVPVALSWRFVPVPGVVTRSELVRGMEGNQIEFEFSYEYAGEHYAGGRQRQIKMFAIDETFVEERPVGTELTGWCDPDAPHVAVARREFGEMQYGVLGAGAVWLCVLSFAMFCEVRSHRRTAGGRGPDPPRPGRVGRGGR